MSHSTSPAVSGSVLQSPAFCWDHCLPSPPLVNPCLIYSSNNTQLVRQNLERKTKVTFQIKPHSSEGLTVCLSTDAACPVQHFRQSSLVPQFIPKLICLFKCIHHCRHSLKPFSSAKYPTTTNGFGDQGTGQTWLVGEWMGPGEGIVTALLGLSKRHTLQGSQPSVEIPKDYLRRKSQWLVLPWQFSLYPLHNALKAMLDIIVCIGHSH